MSLSFQHLLKKYDVQVPRYTSYPTVPSWSQTPEREAWFADIRQTLKSPQSSWSMYLHIPFCETLCTFCGCNTIITKNHGQETSYVDHLVHEFEMYLQNTPEIAQRELRQIHLGGGTPTFLSPENLQKLTRAIFSKIKKTTKDFEASIEVDPRRTTELQLQTLRNLGFDRVSLGVQDFNERVQKLINRIQPFEITEKITRHAREQGYKSVNFDLIYGLPQQDLESMKKTVEQTLRLRPDRIALYSFALVPWIKPAQRLFQDSDLPSTENKRELYEQAREVFLKSGYQEIGMDHFALPTDSLVLAKNQNHLHRNFMGYTDVKTDLLLGLGVSSISESHHMFHQNEKLLPKYIESLDKALLPTHRGHVLSPTDLLQRQKILSLMTQFELTLSSQQEYEALKPGLEEFEKDGLLHRQGLHLKITSLGRPFLRNICSLFDEHLQKNKPEGKIFSKSI